MLPWGLEKKVEDATLEFLQEEVEQMQFPPNKRITKDRVRFPAYWGHERKGKGRERRSLIQWHQMTPFHIPVGWNTKG